MNTSPATTSRFSSPLRATAFTALLMSTLCLPATAQEVPRLNVQGEYINYETPLIKPLLATADGQHVVAINEPDNRVVVRRASDLSLVAEVLAGQGLTAVAERPGGAEIWAAAANSSGVLVIDTTTWHVTHRLQPPTNVFSTLGDAAGPGAIVFSADGSKAWVTATTTDSLLVYDAVNKVHLKTVPLTVTHNGVTSRLKEPRALVRSGETLYALIYRSGNQTAAGPREFGGLIPFILNLDDLPNYSLPDADIVAVSAIDESIQSHQRAVGTLNFGLAVNPVTGDLVVSNMDALNGVYIGEASFPQGRMTLNRLSFISPGTEPGAYNHVALEDLSVPGGSRSLAMPTDVAIDATGRVFVAGYASGAIGAFAADGTYLGILPTDLGPRGLAVSPDSSTLYSLNRIANTLTAFDISNGLPGGAFATSPIGQFDPTFDNVNEGRVFYNDASNSGAGSTGCFSCHPDLQQDSLAWELSAYHDLGDSFTYDNPPRFWKDRKFSMTTQDSRSLEEMAPYHWRGEQKDLEGFNGAFEGLIKGHSLSDDDFAKLKAYTFNTYFPPNPNQQLDRSLDADGQAGFETFAIRENCNDCHTLPLGKRGVTNAVFGLGPGGVAGETLRGSQAAGFRGLWTLMSDLTNIHDVGAPVLHPITGFGLDHVGSHRDFEQFILTQFDFPNPVDRRQLEAFLTQFDTGLAPATAYSEVLNQDRAADSQLLWLVDQANAGNCDIAAHGRLWVIDHWQDTGLVFDRETQQFVTDTSTNPGSSPEQLIARAQNGKADLVVLGVPVWSGERIGVDRDRDGLYDGDEAMAGTDVVDPDSDGDGFWDSYDDNPLDPVIGVTSNDPAVVSNLDIQMVNSNSARIVYETDTFSPTRVAYQKVQGAERFVGDPLELPAGSNRWKRKHAIVLRTLDEGSIYDFRILTRTQKGILGQSEEFTFTSRPKLLQDPGPDDTIQVADLFLEVAPVGAGAEVTATLSVETNLGEVVSGATVNAVWTVFDPSGSPLGQVAAVGGPTDASGQLTMTIAHSMLTSGTAVDLTIPMYVGPRGEEIAGLVDDPITARPFAWPESITNSARISIP